MIRDPGGARRFVRRQGLQAKRAAGEALADYPGEWLEGQEAHLKPRGHYDAELLDHRGRNREALAPKTVKHTRIARALDLSLGLVLLVLASVPMLLVGLLVTATSRGPVIFRQERVGRGGVPFTILKFRTMRDGTYEAVLADPELWKEYVSHDHKLPDHLARTTWVGAVLRKLSLDELPQLINVLRGDMSLVGVRPIERTQLELRSAVSQRLYETLRPGLTGLWQVEGRSALRHEGRVALDDRYVLTWHPMADVKLLLRTPLAVLRMRNAI